MKNLLTQRGWLNANATVTGCEERSVLSMRGRPSRLLSNPRNYYSVSFRYETGGRIYDSDFTAYRAYEEGTRLPILFDPSDPQRNSKKDPRGDQKTTLAVSAICLAAALLFLLFRAVHV
jgi:hypothetical protein